MADDQRLPGQPGERYALAYFDLKPIGNGGGYRPYPPLYFRKSALHLPHHKRWGPPTGEIHPFYNLREAEELRAQLIRLVPFPSEARNG